MNRRIHLTLLFVISAFVSAADKVNDAVVSIPGYLMLSHNPSTPETIKEFARLAGGPESRVSYILEGSELMENFEQVIDAFDASGIKNISYINMTAPGKRSNEIITGSTGAWISSTVLPKLRPMLDRKMVVMLSGTGLMETISNVVYESPKKDNEGKLLQHLIDHPGTVGFDIRPPATLLIHNRSLSALNAPIQIHLAASATRPALIKPLAPGQTADLNALIRAARARSQPPFPPKDITAPGLESGTLVIDGGGIPKAALTRFIEAAGGPDALILACPTAQSDDPWPADQLPNEGKLLMRAGAKNVKTFHLAKYEDAFNEEKIKILREAKGLWFCGGRQWRYVDTYLDTPAEKLMHEILKRGGVIGGSSAGATIQGDYLVRGNPLGNVEMMSEGYERGFAFLKGAAIDQHFFKRNRFADMSALKKTFPQLLGLGIDEGAALVVTGHSLEVVGLKPVAIYNKQSPPENGEKDYLELKPGEKYDLKTKAKIEEKK